MCEDGLAIIMSDKYILKLLDLLGLKEKKAWSTPEPPHQEDVTSELQGEKRQKYCAAVGILLYMGGDRPDCQHSIRSLATCLTKPTEHMYKRLEHLASYLKGTMGYAVKFTKPQPGRSVLHEANGTHW